jgi:hypothetical protein
VTALLTASGPSALWYLTRATGIVALLLLTASVVLGVATSTRWRTNRWPRFLTTGLHRNVSLLVLVFLGAHIVTAVADGFAPIGWIDAVVPFVSRYRPLWLGFGAVSFDLLLALVVTSLLRARIGLRTWRVLHWTAYAAWPVALVHELGTGSDAKVGWSVLLAAACTIAVVLSVFWRLTVGWRRRPVLRAAAAFTALAVPLGILFWAESGPLQHGWARRAGTPGFLLVSSGGRQQASGQIPTPPFSGSMHGTIRESAAGSGGVSVLIAARVQRGVDGVLRMTLTGRSIPGGGVAMRTSVVTFGAPGDQSAYTGKIVRLQGRRILASLTSRSGSPLQLSVTLSIDTQAGTVRGSVTGQTPTTEE